MSKQETCEERIDAALESRLEAFADSVTMTATPIERRTSGDAAWNERALHFAVHLVAPNGKSWSGEYSVGEGIPAMWARKMGAQGLRIKHKVWVGYDALDHALKFPNTVAAVETMDKIRAAYRPSALDVLGALFCDASGVDELTPFREWCEEWGYEGNPADALEAFEGCKRAALFLRRALGRDFEKCAEEAAEL